MLSLQTEQKKAVLTTKKTPQIEQKNQQQKCEQFKFRRLMKQKQNKKMEQNSLISTTLREMYLICAKTGQLIKPNKEIT